MVAPKNRMIGHVFSRKKTTILKLILVQESESTYGNEVTISCSSLQIELELQSKKTINHNLPFVIRKGTRECTKCLLYLLSHVVSFEKFSLSHFYHPIQGFI